MIDQAILREIVSELEQLSEEKAVEVLDFVRFVKSRPEYPYGTRSRHRVIDEAQAAKLYSDAAEEDWRLAESGIAEYNSSLNDEDKDAKG